MDVLRGDMAVGPLASAGGARMALRLMVLHVGVADLARSVDLAVGRRLAEEIRQGCARDDNLHVVALGDNELLEAVPTGSRA